MQLKQLLIVDFRRLGMTELLDALQGDEENVVGSVDGARDAIDWVRDGNASA